ncbi:MAG: amidase [Pseudomonadales bacterium]
MTHGWRGRVGTVLAAWLLAALATAATDDPTRLDASTLATRLAAGEISAVEVTRAHLARIAALDDAGPRLNAVIELNPDAVAIARDLDKHLAARGPKGPLHGVPVILKASIDTGDRMATSAGSLALAEFRAPVDAHLVARLREAGAVIMGKANLSEWANFRSTRSSSGWSSAGGQTRNPHVLDRNPCGSSSGSAVAVAARLTPLAVGTETDGSIVCPAGVNGIVGIKPTVGRISRHGIIPISHSQDTAGPMARTVTDAALLLAAMDGPDPADPATARDPADAAPLLPDPAARRLDGVRIGVNRGYYGAGDHPRVDAVFEQALIALRALGATLVDPVGVEISTESYDAEYQVMLYEFKAGLNAYLAARPVPPDRDSLAELIAWNEAHAARVMPHFGQEIFLEAQAKGGLNEEEYQSALTAGPAKVRADLEAALAEHRLDALISPANGYAWKTDWLAGDRFLVGSSSLAAMSGLPSVTVPAGAVSALPINVAFVGPAFSEGALVRIAYAFEQATGALREPALLPTLEAAGAP